jgi:hypothetical protein
MSGSISDNMQWRSLDAPFNEQGQSLILRDIETLFLAMQQLQLGTGINFSGAPQNVTQSQQPTPNLPPNTGGVPNIQYPIPVSKGGTGDKTLTGYALGNGTNPFTGVARIPLSDGGTSVSGRSAVLQLLDLPVLFEKTSFTSLSGSGNFTVPDYVYKLLVMMGGGGGGGGSHFTQNGNYAFYVARTSGGSPLAPIELKADGGCGGGGGAGIVSLSVTPGDVIAYSVGAGGTAGTPGLTNGGTGGAGGNTSFGTIVASGGSGGGGSSVSGSQVAVGSGGSGGSGVNTTTVFSFKGNDGMPGPWRLYYDTGSPFPVAFNFPPAAGGLYGVSGSGGLPDNAGSAGGIKIAYQTNNYHNNA